MTDAHGPYRAPNGLCPPGHPHNDSCYGNHHCRCQRCRAARAAIAADRRARFDPATFPPDRHGKATTYQNNGCRCEPCRLAHNADTRARRARRARGQEAEAVCPAGTGPAA